jgi:MFS family permease
LTIHVHTQVPHAQVLHTEVLAADSVRRTRVRLFIVLMLFLVTTINYADRATLSIAGTALSKELQLDPIALGYVFSAFSWSYVAAQVPGGWLLDRFGSKWVYSFSILIWSAFTFMQGWIGFFAGVSAIVVLFALRLSVGSRRRRRFRRMRASSRPGLPATNAAPHRPSSIPDNTSPPCCSRR